jgi:menaquinone-dependent protoporphyrinogen oxidase
MQRVLVVYATREGRTRKVAARVAAVLRARGREVDVFDAASPPAGIDPGRYALVVLAASLHMGRHEREMRAFVKKHAVALGRVRTAFLSVSLSEATVEDPSRPEEERAKAARAVTDTIARFLAQTHLRPTWVMPVAGALPYGAYGPVTRLVMREISRKEGGPTDTGRDYEMTDWSALERFAEEAVGSLTPPVETGATA